MRYATTYDIGDRKRADDGINEDSVAVTVLEDGHREGFEPPGVDLSNTDPVESNPTVQGPGDTEQERDRDAPHTETQVFEGGRTRSAFPRNREAGVFVLADGAGGEQAGDVASYIASTVITERLSEVVHRARRRMTGGFGLDLDAGEFGDSPSGSEIRDAIEEAVVEANQTLVEYAQTASLEGIYTTAVVGVYLGDRLYYGWVGDSRMYVVNERHGEISRLTKDHAKVTRWEEEGRIDEVEAHVHPDGNQISRALGGSAGTTVEDAGSRARQDVETGSVPLYRNDTVLLTSDGLIDAQTDAPELYRRYVSSGHDDDVAEEVLDAVVTDDVIRDVVIEADSLQEAADEFVALSNDKGGKDNISIVLFADGVLPAEPDPDTSGLPERSVDPDTPLEERKTVIRDQ